MLLLMHQGLCHGSHHPKHCLTVLKRKGKCSAWRAEGLPSIQHTLDTICHSSWLSLTTEDTERFSPRWYPSPLCREDPEQGCF